MRGVAESPSDALAFGTTLGPEEVYYEDMKVPGESGR